MLTHTPPETAPRPAPAPSPARTEAAQTLEAEFSALMGQIQRLVAETATRLSPGLMPGDYKVFTAIVRAGSVTATALADELLMDKGQISRILRGLQEHGLIDRTPDPADARVSLVTPTAVGLAKLDAARHPHQHSLIDALELWDVEDIRTLTRLLHALRTATPPTAP
ncbi:MarR family winged helix-turn-helix transcriptional regulator [Microbacterium mangrovi]|uniref:MarR family winged helix-turn-helix transcriptional regulator n=1 Tax=Microbacterium mangrovi TaxID=1348253 RepID=UPI00069225DB|nr:MarR family winged helix-turn-helix transcriptional regulator [Microbacterium mangrovi]